MDDYQGNVFKEVAVAILKASKKYFDRRTKAWLTADDKINLSAAKGGFTGTLSKTIGGTGSDVGFADHSHDGTRSQGQKLIQDNTHETPDTDIDPAALHHTLGNGANQAAPGNHPLIGSNHTATGLTPGDVLTATSPSAFAFAPSSAARGSAWSILTAGTVGAPTIVFAGGQVVMIEIYR